MEEVEVTNMDKSNGGRMVKVAATAALLAAVAGAATEARADDVKRATSEAGVGLTQAVANVFYIPAKIGYAALGGVTGGLGYILTGGNREVADRVWVSSFGGDYVLSRGQIKGEERINFAGTTDPDM
jgi:hypothetical protein